MEEDAKVLEQLTEKLDPSKLESHLVMNEITPEDLCTLTSTLNVFLNNLTLGNNC